MMNRFCSLATEDTDVFAHRYLIPPNAEGRVERSEMELEQSGSMKARASGSLKTNKSDSVSS